MELSPLAKRRINKYDFNDNYLVIVNEWLYQITKKKPSNTNKDVIASKLLIIGRTYAAALERVQDKDIKINYNAVAKKIIDNKIEQDINALKTEKNIDENTILKVASLHYKLTKIFEKDTKIDKRSLASKYLHFHLPNIVFIYDQRVKTTIGKFVKGKVNIKDYPKIQEKLQKNKEEIDREYTYYCLKAFVIYNELKNRNEFIKGKESLPRYVDTLLLRYSDKNGI